MQFSIMGTVILQILPQLGHTVKNPTLEVVLHTKSNDCYLNFECRIEYIPDDSFLVLSLYRFNFALVSCWRVPTMSPS